MELAHASAIVTVSPAAHADALQLFQLLGESSQVQHPIIVAGTNGVMPWRSRTDDQAAIADYIGALAADHLQAEDQSRRPLDLLQAPSSWDLPRVLLIGP